MSAYEDFLATKRRRAGDDGVEIEPGQVHPSLFDFQRDIVGWAARKGRAALFADTGLGKTRMQVEWARLITPDTERSLIVAPLSVARQTVREGETIGDEIRYVRHGDEADGPGMWITNYEMVEHFDPAKFTTVVLDESSCLKNVDAKRRRILTEQFAHVPHRLACTATPAPNDVAELCNHAEFLGVMPRVEMLAAYFIHDEDGWRPKGHALEPMYEWMTSWAIALRRPSDLGYPDDGYDLPPLRIHPEVVKVELEAAEGSLFASLGGVSGRSKVRRETMDERVKRAAELANADDQQWIVWCGLNDEADMAEAMIEGAVNVPGAWTPERKADALEAFQDGAIRVLVSKPAICGFGMNFQMANRMAFVGIGDSYESYYQSIRRCYRFGQTEPVDVHIIVSELESAIVANVQRKEATASHTTDALIRHMKLREGVTA